MSPTELYVAQKLRSKLSRALHALNEARQAAAVLPPSILSAIGLPNAIDAISGAANHVARVRLPLRQSVPALDGADEWESRHE